MFKKTLRLLNQNLSKQENPYPKKVIDNFTPNYDLLDNLKHPYDIKADYLPRRKINPFRRKPLRVIYDHNDFNNFVLPSRRGSVFTSIYL